MSDQRWTDEIRDRLADVIVNAEFSTDAADRVLATLADLGLLVEPGGESRVERGYWNPAMREVQSWWSYSDSGYKAPDRVRTVTTWPDGSCHTGPWRPTSSEEPT